MKRISSIFFFVAVVSLSACIKNEDVTFQNRVAEIDQTTYNANASGLTYPILTRIPAMGRAVAAICPDSVLRKFSGTMRLRINLVGPQSSKEETVGYSTFAAPVTTATIPATILAGGACTTAQAPARAAAALPVITGVAGTHYTLAGAAGKITIPANSSFGYLDIQLLNGASSANAAFIGIRLDSTGSVLPNFNYRDIGILVDQR